MDTGAGTRTHVYTRTPAERRGHLRRTRDRRPDMQAYWLTCHSGTTAAPPAGQCRMKSVAPAIGELTAGWPYKGEKIRDDKMLQLPPGTWRNRVVQWNPDWPGYAIDV